MEDQSIEDELLLILLSVLYLLVRLFSLLTPAGLSLDDRISFAIAMLELTRDLRYARSLLLFVFAESTNGPMASVLGSSELISQKLEQVLSAGLAHSQRLVERRRRDKGLPRP